MTNGVGTRNCADIAHIKQRKRSSDLASKILGFQWAECYDFNDNAMDGYPLIDIVRAVQNAKIKYEPTLVYTHSGADLNVDHRLLQMQF